MSNLKLNSFKIFNLFLMEYNTKTTFSALKLMNHIYSEFIACFMLQKSCDRDKQRLESCGMLKTFHRLTGN